jgi:hypothetical protein
MRVVLLTVLLLISNLHSLVAQSKEEKAVLNLSLRKFEWLVNKQADSLNAILDERVLYVHSNGWSQSKQEIVDDMHTGKLIYKQVTIKDARVRMYANTALVTGTGRFSGSREGHEFDMDLFYTEVYVRKGKKWMLASRHSNRLP